MAGKTIRARVKPEILVWARESAGFSLEQVEASSGLSKIREWESGEVSPTMNQLRTLAKKYKRPLAVFYLQEKPEGFQVLKDFRRLPGTEMRQMSPKLTLAVRQAQENREVALEYLAEVGIEPPKLTLSASIEDDPETVGARARAFLKITEATQGAWRTKEDAFKGWRQAIEGSGVLVFQLDKIDPDEASGFAIAEEKLSAIAVNRADVPARRSFTLLHEFAHLLLRESGVSDFYLDLKRPPEDQRIEVWCNAVAAATLMPKAMFLGHETVRAHRGGNTWAESEIDDLAKHYSLSRISVVRRLLTLGLTSQAFYKKKERQYAEDYAAERARKSASYEGKDFGGRQMHNEALSLLGRSFVRMVLQPYHENRITLNEVSAALGIKTRHIPNIERALLSRPA